MDAMQGLANDWRAVVDRRLSGFTSRSMRENLAGFLQRESFRGAPRKARIVTMSAHEGPHFHDHVDLQIETLLHDSEGLAGLAQNWDGQGASAIQPETWERTVRILRNMVCVSHHLSGRQIRKPQLLASPDGDIDIFWEWPGAHVVLTVPEDPHQRPRFFGQAGRKAADRKIISGPITFDETAEIPDDLDRTLFVWLQDVG